MQIVIALLCTGCVHKLNAVTTKAEIISIPDVNLKLARKSAAFAEIMKEA